MFKLIKQILINQLVIMNQLAVFYDRFDEVLKNSGERPLKSRHKCKLIEDQITRTRNIIKENENEVCNIPKTSDNGG